jgi:hypothetical protein
MLKPNLSELVHITNYCLQQGLIRNGKAMVSTVLSTIASDRIDIKSHHNQNDKIDINDIRTLSIALLRVLYGNSRFKLPSPQESASLHLITGKHLIVSLGKRGILWCCPAKALSPEDKTALNKIFPHNSNNVVISGDDDNPFMTCHIPVVEEIPSFEIKHGTNGAGDALCAGIIYGMLQGSGLLNKTNVIKTPHQMHSKLFPNFSNMKMGLENAKNWIKRK